MLALHLGESGLRHCDMYFIDEDDEGDAAFYKKVVLPCLTEMMKDEEKLQVPIHYRYGMYSMKNEEVFGTLDKTTPTRHKMCFIMDPPNSDAHAVNVSDAKIDKKIRQKEVMRQIHTLPRTVLIVFNNKDVANVFVMDQQFGFRLMTYTSGEARRLRVPVSRQLEAQLYVLVPSVMPWLRECREFCGQNSDRYLINRLLMASYLQRLRKWHVDTRSDDAAHVDSHRDSTWPSEFNRPFAAVACAELSEIGLDSVRSGSTNAGDDEMYEIQPRSELAIDSHRSGICAHEFSDRLRTVPGQRRLAERAARVVAAAEMLLGSISQEMFNQNWTQVDLFYLYQLMALACKDDSRVSRLPIATSLSMQNVIAQCSPAVHAAVAQVNALRYVFLVDRERRKMAGPRTLGMVTCALWYKNNTYTQVRNLFDEINFGYMLDALQLRRTPRQRRHEMTLVRLTGQPLFGADARAALDQFVQANALVADAAFVSAGAYDVLVRVALNDASLRQRVLCGEANANQRATESYVAARTKRNGMLREERVTPMSITSAVRNAMPTALDGAPGARRGFLTVWTPLSYVTSNDRRYQRAAWAASNDPNIYIGDDVDDYELPTKVNKKRRRRERDAGSDDADAQDDDEFDPNNRKTRKTKRRLNGKTGRPRKKIVVDDASNVPLAEPAIYVAMSAEVWRNVSAARASTLLLQRGLFSTTPMLALRNYDAPLAGPLVAEQLATSTDIDTICACLNAVSTLVGGSSSEWLPGTVRADKCALRAARTTIAWFELAVDNRPRMAARSVLNAVVWRTRMLALVADAMASRRAESDNPRYMALDRPHLDQCNLLSPLAIILNGNALPVLTNDEYFPLLHRACAGDARLRAHIDMCEQRAPMRTRWATLPTWYATALNWRRFKMPREDCEPKRRKNESEEHFIERQEAYTEYLTTKDDVEAERAAKVDREHELRERMRKLAQAPGGTHKSHCDCGGATNEECVTLMAAVCDLATTGDDDGELNWTTQEAPAKRAPCCCLCMLDSLPPAAKHTAYDGILSGVCTWCRQRVPWYIDGKDECATNGFVSLYEPGDAVTALDVVEYVVAWALAQRAIDSASDDVRLVVNFVQALRFRLRNWTSVTPTPRACARYRTQLLSPNLNRLTPIAQRISELSNPWVRSPLKYTLELAGAVEFEADDDQSAEQNPRFVETWTRISSAAFVFSTLEVVAMTCHTELTQVCGTDPVNPARAGSAAVEGLVDLLLPVRSARQTHRYCRRYAQRVHTFPLCASALAESTAHGAVALSSMASNMALPLNDRMQHMLYNSQMPRPLSACLPLLQELMLMRWYDADAPVALADDDDEGDAGDDEEKSIRSCTASAFK